AAKAPGKRYAPAILRRRIRLVLCDRQRTAERRRYHPELHLDQRTVGVINPCAGPYHRVPQFRRTPGETEPWRQFLRIERKNLRVYLPQPRVSKQSRRPVDGVRIVPCPVLRVRNRRQEPRHAVVQSQRPRYFPCIADVWQVLRESIRQPWQSVHRPGYRISEQEIGEAVAGIDLRHTLSLCIRRNLRRKQRLESETAQRARVGVLLPRAPVTNSAAELYVVTAVDPVHPLVDLIAVVDVSQVPRAVPESRITLPGQRNPSHAAIVERVRNPDLPQDVTRRQSLARIQRDVAHEPDPRRINERRTDRPRVLRHPQLAAVRKQRARERKQTAGQRRRILMQELSVERLLRTDRVVRPNTVLVVVQRVLRISEKIRRMLRQAR